MQIWLIIITPLIVKPDQNVYKTGTVFFTGSFWWSPFDKRRVSMDWCNKFMMLLFQRFDLQMSAKQPLYCITRRQGTSMRDRCAKSDPERTILNEMVEELSSRWNQLRSIILQRLDSSINSSLKAQLIWCYLKCPVMNATPLQSFSNCVPGHTP